MRIVDVRTVLLTGPCTHDPWLSVFKQWRTSALVEIETDAGVVGLGETYAGYFFPESVPLVVDYLRPVLLAVDGVDEVDFEVPDIVARMRTCFQYWGRVGLGAAVLAGIEGALWDLLGKVRGLPVHRLLSADAPASLPVYATGGPSPWPTDDLLRKVDFYLGLGFPAVKLSSGYLDSATRAEVPATGLAAVVDTEVGKAALLRETFSADLGLLLDGHMGHREGPERWDVDTAKAVLHALAPYNLTFFEEPLPYDDIAGYAELTRHSAIPVAGGEQLSTVGEFAAFAERDAFAVAQPDAAWLGIGGFVEVGRLFAEHDRRVAPHAWSGGVGVMQNVHAAFGCGNVVTVEVPPAAGPLHTQLWRDSLRLEGGRVLRPDAPGLGVDLTEATRAAYPFRPGAEEFSSVPGKVMRS
ncbi:MAG: mandelate racemase/muconate lactonizing enzyme family protein [Actinomycetota bacterium]|nr:mandelate racemase/muconate lactonizing enzyme family protein [Actinomycetota bacterium]